MSNLFGPTRQLGLVVRDFDAAVRGWTNTCRVGPFYHFRDMPVEGFMYRGKSSPTPLLSIAFGYSGDLQIEIIHQQNDVPSLYRDFLASGREGLQHISGFCDSREEFDRMRDAATAAGVSVVQEGAIGGIRFAYFDTERKAGDVTCELSESDMEGPLQLFTRLRAHAAAWDGTDPLRPLADL